MATRATGDVKAADSLSLSELTQVSKLFRETTQNQTQLLGALQENLKETFETLGETTQALSDLLQIMTSQSEKVEAQMAQLVAVTVALTKATTALRALPVGSAVQHPDSSRKR